MPFASSLAFLPVVAVLFGGLLLAAIQGHRQP